MDKQDIIVIGASAGGVTALRALVNALPATLQATLFIVVHTTPDSPGHLADVLCSAGPLPASNAIDNEAFLPGHIYVAPPNYHLLVMQDHLRTTQGPLENHVRPSIDVLFRSAALAYGNRVTGIILSGLLDDGAAGLGVIKDFGGRTIVQEPGEAQFKDMPLNALHQGKVDFCLTIAKIALLLADPDHTGPGAVAGDADLDARRRRAAIENAIAERLWADEQALDSIGQPSRYTCPECHGTLWQIPDWLPRFRCRTGHAFTVRTLMQVQEAAKEAELWQALRVLEEIDSLAKWIGAERPVADPDPGMGAHARRVEAQLVQLRRLLGAAPEWPDHGNAGQAGGPWPGQPAP